MTETCGFFTRRWHARMRRIDREVLFPILREQAGHRASGETSSFAKCSAAYKGKIDEYGRQAIALHKTLPGQGHWRCACASEVERTEPKAGEP